MKNKKRNLLVLICILLALVAAVLVTIHVFKISDEMNVARAQKYGLEYAKKDCYKTSSSSICDNLQVYTNPPTAWNEVDYLVYVESSNKDKFDATVSVQIDIKGKMKVVEYNRYDGSDSQKIE